MEFLFKDNGYGISPSMMQQLNNQTFVSTGSGGFGISNIKERLQLFYGDSCSLLYTTAVQGGTEVTLRIPLVRETNSS